MVEAWQYDAVVSDGAWHGVELRLARDSLQLGVDSSLVTRSLQQPVRTGACENTLELQTTSTYRGLTPVKHSDLIVC